MFYKIQYHPFGVTGVSKFLLSFYNAASLSGFKSRRDVLTIVIEMDNSEQNPQEVIFE